MDFAQKRKLRKEILMQYEMGVFTYEEVGELLDNIIEKYRKANGLKIMAKKRKQMRKRDTSSHKADPTRYLEQYKLYKNKDISDAAVAKKIGISSPTLSTRKKTWVKMGLLDGFFDWNKKKEVHKHETNQI